MENIIRFTKGKKKGYIGHNNDGKVVLARNKVQPGYYKLNNVDERENVILANAERIPYDYFPKITYDEFLDVLRYNGFKIGFIEDFHYTCGEYEGDDHLIFAYDMQTHIIIVAESWDSGRCFNTVNMYCPGMKCSIDNKLISSVSRSCTEFNLCRGDILHKNTGVIHMFKEHMSEIEDNDYKEDVSISLWNYSEVSGANTYDFYNRCRGKIKRADRKDMLELFAHDAIMMNALNS